MPNYGITAGELGSTASVSWCRAMGGTLPATSGMQLTDLSVYVRTTHTTQVRLAVYLGGSLTTGPIGATLVDEAITTGGATSQYLTVSGLSGSLTANSVFWIAIKGNDSGFDMTYSTDSGDAGDFQSARGRWVSMAIDTDESVAFPATWPADGTGAFANYWYSTYLTYSASGGGAGPQYYYAQQQ